MRAGSCQPGGPGVLKLAAPRALLDGALSGPVVVSVDGAGAIAGVDQRPPHDGDVVLEPGGVLTAGMVDLQLNGAAGVDLAAAGDAGWDRVAAHVAAHGVTAFCPTFITAPLERLVELVGESAAQARRLAGRPVSQPVGAHLEGPFLSPARPGAHQREAMRLPDAHAIDAVIGVEGLRLVTLAPELDGGHEAIRRLRAAGVRVSIGHSDATAAQVADAARAGATLVTHLFNAQRPFAHREPGVAGRALVDERLTCGLIVDLHHVAADAVKLAFAAAPGRIALVSDAVAAAGMPPGPFAHGPLRAFAVAGGPPVLADATFAGSALHLDEAVRNAVSAGVGRAAALTAATAVPAAAAGLHDRGEIVVGRRADLAWWDPELRVRRVWIGGAEAAGPSA
jgi:N-acetylglucosamine-6-phosphate deacetylase